jgi:putative ATP-dependent endonuclease of the OLD family
MRAVCQRNAPLWPTRILNPAAANGDDDDHDQEDEPVRSELTELESDYIRVFLGETTFERELATSGNLAWLGTTAQAIGAPRIAASLRAAAEDWEGPGDGLKDAVLRTAERFGKGRFAQIAARYVGMAEEMPNYIYLAIGWLRTE